MNNDLPASVEEALTIQRALAKATRLDPRMALCNLTHAPRWHAFSVMEHIRQVTHIAKSLVLACEAPTDLLITAVWHDVGKFISIQYGPKGPTFRNHAAVGAQYLEDFRNLPAPVVEAIRWHGRLKDIVNRQADLPSNTLLSWLELCDEFGKWTEVCFPPEGTDRTRRKRDELLEKIVALGIKRSTVTLAQQIAEESQRGILYQEHPSNAS